MLASSCPRLGVECSTMSPFVSQVTAPVLSSLEVALNPLLLPSPLSKTSDIDKEVRSEIPAGAPEKVVEKAYTSADSGKAKIAVCGWNELFDPELLPAPTTVASRDDSEDGRSIVITLASIGGRDRVVSSTRVETLFQVNRGAGPRTDSSCAPLDYAAILPS